MNLNDFRKKIPQLEGLDDEAALNLLHEVYYPDADKARMATALGVKITKPEPVRPQNTLMGFIGDRGLDLVKGAVAVPEAAVGVADLVTGGAAGRAAEEIGFRPREAKEMLSGMQSDAYRDRQAQFQAADGIVAKTGVALTNPSLIAGAVTESLPLMAAGGAVGRGVMAAAPKLASPVVAGALGEGAVAAGSTAEQVRQQTADGYLTPKQAVLSAAAGVGTAAFGYAGAKAAKAMGIADLDTALVRGSMQATRDSQIGVIKRVAGGMFAESMLEELPQSVVEQMAQNIALDKPVMQDVDSAIVMGPLSGAAMGGSAALLSRPKTPTEDAADTIRTNKVPEAGTLSKAVNTGIEASAKAVEATAPAPSLTNFDPATMIPENPLLAGARVRENDSRQEAMTDQAMAKLERMNANDMAVINSARFDQSRGANEISPTEVVEPAQAGDILNPAGEPFKTRMAADRAAKKTPGAVVPVEGGFIVRPQESVNVQDVLQAPEVSQAAPVVSPPGQATQAVGAQPAGPTAGVPTEGSGAVEATGVSGEFADLFDEQGRPKFSNAQSVKDFKKRTGLGQDGVRAIQVSIQEGRPITVDEARQVDLAGQERRKAGLEQSKADSEADAQAAKQNSANPTEPSKVLGDYEIPGLEGGTNRVRVIQRGGRIEAISLEEGTVSNDLSRLIQSGQTVEQALAALYGDHGPNEAPNPSRVKRAGQPTSAAAPADDTNPTSGTRTEAQAPADQAPAPARSDAAAAAGVPATPGAGDVQADGVTLKKAIDSAYMVANGYFGSDFVGVSIQNDWQRLLDAAGKKDVQALSDLESKYRKDEERDGMGAGTSGAGPGKVKQARRGAAQIPRFAREIRQAIGADLSKNPPNPNTSAEPAQKTAKSEQVDSIAQAINASIADGAIKKNSKFYAEKVAKGYMTQEEADRRAAADAKTWSEQKPTDRTLKIAKAIADKDPTVLVGAWANEGQGTYGNEGSMEAFRKLTGINLKRLNSADRAKAIFDWAGWSEDQVRADVEKRKAAKAEAAAAYEAKEAAERAEMTERQADKTPLRVQGKDGETTVKAYVDDLIAQGYTDIGQTQKGAVKQVLLFNPKTNSGYPMPKGILADYAKQAVEKAKASKAAQQPAEGAKSEPFEHAGLKIRPSRVKEGDQVVDRWVVQSPENAEREARGERQIGGDRIVETREQAIKTADQEAKRYAKEKADRAEMDAREKAERDAAEARREANKGKTLTEIKADGYMAQEIKDGKTGDVLTRAEWVKRLVDGGAKLSVEMVNKIKPMSRAAFNRATNQEQAAHEKKVKAAGQVPEYSIGDFIVTKTEYDFAQKLVSSALTAPTPAPDATKINGPATAQRAIDAFNADDAATAQAVMAKLPIAELQVVGDAIGFRPQINENAKRYRERVAEVADRLTKTAREQGARERALFDKLMNRAMEYDRAADHAERARNNGVTEDGTAYISFYRPMDGGESQEMRIPAMLERLAADVRSLRNDPDYAKVSGMVREARPRVFEAADAPPAAESDAPAAPAAPASKTPIVEAKKDEPATPPEPKAEKPGSAEELRAKADLQNALADLADILTKGTRMYIVPADEQKLLPVLTRVMDAAFRLGYIKFKQAARFALDEIRKVLGSEAADQLTLDHLQGAYIAMAGKYQAQGADKPKAVTAVDSLEEITALEDADQAKTDGELENSGKPADTGEKDSQNDPPAQGSSDPLNNPMVAGPAGKPAVARGARVPRRKPGRADVGELRDSGGLFENLDDESGNVGDSRGDAVVPDRPDDALAGNDSAVSAPDYRAPEGSLTRKGSWYDTAARNIDLIEMAIAIEAEGRPATPDEQDKLAKYVGFGAGEIRNKLFPVPHSYAKQQEPDRLIWPNLISDARWKALAERMDKLPREWQKSVLQSTQYAHYTSEGVIRSIWTGVQRMGFTGGKVLEPGSGIGSFAMLMPDSARKSGKYTGIEFDGPTALIAKLLSPQQNMLHADFIKRNLPKDFFDLAIGNPPFSQTKILGDPEYAKRGFMLHDFFFAKSLDRVRPGGLLVFVTSKGTMDKQSDKARKYLSERADLMGAIRLPQTAFEENAGTKVVTDIIFLRKRMPGEAPRVTSQGRWLAKINEAGEAVGQAAIENLPQWLNVKTIETKDGPAVVNEYFAAHPEMVLGQQRMSGNQDDEGRRISGLRGIDEYTVVSYDKTPAELEAKIAKAVESLPENVYSVLSGNSDQVRAETAKVDFDPKVKREGVVYLGEKNQLMRVQSGVGRPLADSVKLSDKDRAWYANYIEVRDLVQEARAAQVADGQWEAALKKLNAAYDAFRKKHGPINDFRVQIRKNTDEEGNEVETEIRVFKNRRLYREDYDASVVTQLETINEAGEVVKAPFLLGRTIGKPVVRDVKSVGDALAVSLDELGRLDLDDIGRRMKLPRAEVIEALGTQIYETPAGQWQLADEYLSGDVVGKLEEAEEAARVKRSLSRNVEALKSVQPEKLGPSQISVKLGASWVPADYVTEFAKEIGAGAVKFDIKTESWQVEGGNMRSQRTASAEYGTADRSPSELLEAALNSRTVTIKKKTDDKKEVTDADATAAAAEAIKKIREKFKSWIWTDSDRASELVEVYNTRFNNIAPRRFDGDHLTLPGVSLRFKLHPHQLRAIWRQIQTGDTYLAHAVGAGKTIEMIAGGMEQKRLGLIKKPMYVVPNHMLEQFANEFMELYPLANIMVADDENFSAERRRAFVAAATLNAPDAIVITHSAFERIGVKEETVAPIRDEILLDLETELEDADKGDRVRRSQLEQQIEAVTQRFDRIVSAGGKDSTIKFEDIGADYVYVDEAHVYRKLDFSTNQKLKGIDPNGSKRALDMYVKTRYLRKQRPGRAMTFASGTPVTNTMGELYTIMRFFAPDELDRAGIATFDGWARQFGESVAALEANAAGRYEVVERFAKFDNVPELMSRVRQFMDVLTSESLGSLVKRPDVEGGKPNLVMVEGTPELKGYMKTVLLPRLEASRRWKPSKDEPFNPDPVIAITSDGRFAALDPRFFGAKVDDTTPTKLNAMADAIAAEYKATAENVYQDKAGGNEPVKGSTQIVFYNLGFGAQSQQNRGFDSRGALNKRLTAAGVKREHIAWFDDADTDAKKEAIFKGMRAGQIRVLIGSAKKMGTGVNVQKRLSMLHYFDPPWFPSDVEQPHGRIIRQGNQNEKVRINWYATKGTYDSTMWQMVARKQRFIDQAFTGDKSVRSMDDMSEASQYEQAAAMASGDPRALQLAGLRQDVERMERLQSAHASEQIAVRSELRSTEWRIENTEKRIKTYGDAFKALGERYISFTTAKVGNATFTRLGEFGQALKDAFNKGAADHAIEPAKDAIQLGSIEGLPLAMYQDFDRENKPSGIFELVVDVGGYKVQIASGPGMDERVDAVGLGRRVVNGINEIDRDLRVAKGDLVEQQNTVKRLRKKMGAPFEYQQELAEKYGELKRLEEELKAEGEAEAKAAASAVVINADGSFMDPSLPVNTSVNARMVVIDKPVGAPAFSRTPATQAAIGTPAATIRAAITKAYGKLLGQLESKGLVTLTQTEDEAIEAAAQARAAKTGQSVERERAALRASVKNSVADPDIRRSADGAIQGFFDPQTGQSFLIADNLTAEAAPGVLMHEVGIHMAADGSMKALFNRAAMMLKLQRGNPFMKAVQARMDAAGETSGEEAAAYIAEAYENDRANAPASVQRWLADLLAAVKAWMFKKGIMGAGRLTVADIAAVARANAKTLARGQQGIRAALAFSKAFQPVWYSALQNSIGSLNMKAAPATGWASTIDGLVKAGKVKADEVEWSGVKEWLQLQTGKVTREQVMEYLDANGVQVQEVTLGAGDPNQAAFDAVSNYAEENGLYFDERGTNGYGYLIREGENGSMSENDGAQVEQEGKPKEIAEALGLEFESDNTKYSQYTLPGGENYREVLLTLPEKKNAPVDGGKSAATMLFERDMMEKYGGDTFPSVYNKLSPSEVDRYEMYVREDRNAAKSESLKQDRANNYKSSHWDTPNVLAHLRLNDRTDADGKRVLFVEEIQSDWGQDGKKKGFRGQPVMSGEEFIGLNDSGVPRAPFVDKTDKWLTLALKRVITMAAQEGYDRVAFVNGEQSAERYDLSKQVRSIAWTGRGNDTEKTVTITPNSGNDIEFKVQPDGAVGSMGGRSTGNEFDGKRLDEIVGKDVAERIMGASYGDMRGNGLKVGGEGMKSFYDKIVPAAANKLLAKLGGEKMAATPVTMDGMTPGMMDTRAEAEQWVKANNITEPVTYKQEARYGNKWTVRGANGSVLTGVTLQQPGFNITPAMREKVAGGLPLFSRQAQGQNQTDTPAFKAWFGDSKVVDAGGKPLVVYHGTTADLSAFDLAFSGSDGVAYDRPAIFATDDARLASDYARNKRNRSIADAGRAFQRFKNENPGVYDEEYERLFEAYKASGRKEGWDIGGGANVLPLYLSIQNPLEVDGGGQRFMQVMPDAVKQATEQGRDGVIVRNVIDHASPASEYPATVYVAFRPEQIKSAIGNNGDFDPSNPDIRFSRAADLRKEAAGQVVDLFHTATNVPGRMNWWHKTVGTMYNLAQRSPEFKRVFSAVQDFIDDTAYYADRAARLAPNILPKLETWRDVFKSPMSAVDNRAIRAPIFEGTLTWMRDESGKPVKAEDVRRAAEDLTVDQKAQRLLRNDFVTDSTLRMWRGLPLEQYESIIEGSYERHMLRAGIVFTPAELKSLFKLTDGQVKLYQEFRRATDMSLTNLAISEMVKLGGQDTASMRQAALESEDVVKASAMLRDHLLELADSDAEKSKGYIDAANKIIALSDKAKNLMDKGYAPLSRFGHYTVDVVGPDGTREYFGMFESRFEAAKMAEAMAKNYPDARIERGTVSEQAYKLFAGVTPETIELFGEILGLDTQGDGTQNQAFKAFVQRATANRSAMKRLLERKGIAGFSEDAGRVLAGFVFSNGRRTAGNLHGMEMKEAAEAIPKQQGELKDHAVALVEYVQNPQEEAQGLRGLLFTQYIGGSIASAIVNMTQPLTMSLPYLSQFGGITQAGRQMARAVKDVGKTTTGDKALDAAMTAAEEKGIVSPQEVHQLQQQAAGRAALQVGDGTMAGDARAKAGNALSKTMLAWGKLFSAAEQFNRRVTFIAAYRTAVDRGIENPAKFAEDAVIETQGLYNKGNKPKWARGAIGSTLFTFKQYSVAYVEMLGRLAQSGPEGRRAALYALAILFMLSGAGGMPGADDLDDLISGLMQKLGYNFNSKSARRAFFAKHLGQAGSDFVERGVSGLAGVPIDISGRMGLGNLIPGTGLLTKKTDHTSDVAELAGPAGDLAKRAFQAGSKAMDGDLIGKDGAVTTIAPLAVRNLSQAADMAKHGMYRDARGRKVVETDQLDALSKAFGFQPNDVKRVQDATREVQQMISLNKIRESEIADQWAKAMFERDKDGVQEARDALKRWNADNPESPIRISMQQINKRLANMRMSKEDRMAKTASKEIRATVRRELEAAR